MLFVPLKDHQFPNVIHGSPKNFYLIRNSLFKKILWDVNLTFEHVYLIATVISCVIIVFWYLLLRSHDDRLHTSETQSLSVDPVLMTPNIFLVINGGRQKSSEKVIAGNNMLLRAAPKEQSNNERFKRRFCNVFLRIPR